MLFVELIAQGLVQGSIYALIALGLTLVYGLLRILHVAHAALFTLGGYMGVLVTNQTGSLGLAVMVAMLVAGIAGVLMYRFCYEPILHQPPFVPLIASIGLFIASEEIYRLVFGAYGLSYANPPLQGQVAIGALSFKQAELTGDGGRRAGHRRSSRRCKARRAWASPARPPSPIRRWPSPSAST